MTEGATSARIPKAASETRDPARPGRAVVAGVVAGVLTFAAYVPGLGRSLDFDSAETVGLFIRPGPPWAAFRQQAVFNNHPFFSFLEQLVRVASGHTDAATMRLLPIACGAATVGVVAWYCVGRFGLLAGAVASSVVALNPTFNGLSRAVRGYSLLALCATVSSVIVAGQVTRGSKGSRTSRRGVGVAYVCVAAAGVATHLFMVPVVAIHVVVVAAARQLDARWRQRFLTVALLAVLAYSGMARTMLDANAVHGRVIQLGLPWDVAEVALGGRWAVALLAPVVVVGVLAASHNRSAVVAVAAFSALFLLVWAVVQSGALTARFFIFVVPAVGVLVAFAVHRMRALAVLATASAVVAFMSIAGTYRHDPTSYRQAASLIRSVHAAGRRSCVVDVGVSAMSAYVDDGRDFAVVTEPDQLDACDVVVVASWWHTDADWFRRDNEVIAEAERRFANRAVLDSDDPALVLSNVPLSALR